MLGSFGVESKDVCRTRGGTDRSGNAGRVKPAGVCGSGIQGLAHAYGHLVSGHTRGKEITEGPASTLDRRHYRRPDDDSRME